MNLQETPEVLERTFSWWKVQLSAVNPKQRTGLGFFHRGG